MKGLGGVGFGWTESSDRPSHYSLATAAAVRRTASGGNSEFEYVSNIYDGWKNMGLDPTQLGQDDLPPDADDGEGGGAEDGAHAADGGQANGQGDELIGLIYDASNDDVGTL